jgi:hypothetical protein
MFICSILNELLSSFSQVGLGIFGTESMVLVASVGCQSIVGEGHLDKGACEVW